MSRIALQGIDAGGKRGTIRSVMSRLDPAVGVPSEEARAHDFLGVQAHAPTKSRIGVFGGSHDEDVLVVWVHELVDIPDGLVIE